MVSVKKVVDRDGVGQRPDVRKKTKYPEEMTKDMPSSNTKHLEMALLFCMGLLLLGLALFFDPIGSDPDSGLIELTKAQAQWLLGGFGALFIAASVVLFIKQPRRS